MGASTVRNGHAGPFIPRRRIVLTGPPSRNYCGHNCWSVSLVLLGCSTFTAFTASTVGSLPTQPFPSQPWRRDFSIADAICLPDEERRPLRADDAHPR